MSTQQTLALPAPAPSNTVVINARCSLRIEADRRVIVIAGLPVHHYRAEDAVAEAYAGGWEERYLHPPSNEVGQRWGAATIGHVEQVDACHHIEQLARYVAPGAVTG
jgi:hypothetical protein